MTGGIGSGKSTAAEYFRAKGAVVIDLDDVAANVSGAGLAASWRVSPRSSAHDILLADGRLDRAALARAGVCVAARRASRLNAIVHPADRP